MNAREMFEKLGYEYSHPNKYIVVYQQYHGLKRYENYTMFIFDLQYKVVRFENSYFESKYIQNEFTLDEIKAINQQIKELGWLDE